MYMYMHVCTARLVSPPRQKKPKAVDQLVVGGLEPPVIPVCLDSEVIDRVAHASKVSGSLRQHCVEGISWFVMRLLRVRAEGWD